MNLGLSRWRTTALLALAVVLSALTIHLALRRVGGVGPDFDSLLVAGGLWALALGSVWLTLVLASLTIEAWVGGAPKGPKAPAALRALVTVSAGLAISSAALVTPGHAADPGSASTTGTAATAPSGLEGLRLPERSIGAPPAVERPRADNRAGAVTVRPGDTLWRIARSALPRGSDNRALAAAVRAWHQTNRPVIGPDPDVLHPGQELNPPKEKS